MLEAGILDKELTSSVERSGYQMDQVKSYLEMFKKPINLRATNLVVQAGREVYFWGPKKVTKPWTFNTHLAISEETIHAGELVWGIIEDKHGICFTTTGEHDDNFHEYWWLSNCQIVDVDEDSQFMIDVSIRAWPEGLEFEEEPIGQTTSVFLFKIKAGRPVEIIREVGEDELIDKNGVYHLLSGERTITIEDTEKVGIEEWLNGKRPTKGKRPRMQ